MKSIAGAMVVAIAALCSDASAVHAMGWQAGEIKRLRINLPQGKLDRPVDEASKIAFVSGCCPGTIKNRDVVAISWEGPRDGYLILLDEARNVVSQVRTGYIKSISLYTVNGSNDLILVDATRGGGSGYRKDQYSVFGFENDGLRVLWEGTSYEKSFPLALDPKANFEIVGTVSLREERGGKIILEHVEVRTVFALTSDRQAVKPARQTRKATRYILESKRFIPGR